MQSSTTPRVVIGNNDAALYGATSTSSTALVPLDVNAGAAGGGGSNDAWRDLTDFGRHDNDDDNDNDSDDDDDDEYEQSDDESEVELDRSKLRTNGVFVLSSFCR